MTRDRGGANVTQLDVPGQVKCASCAKPSREPLSRFFLDQRWTGRHVVQLCAKCSGSISWRAAEPVLIRADSAPESLPEIFAGPMARKIWRNLTAPQT